MRIRQIKETVLYVSNLDQARVFYHEKLGLPVVGQKEGRHIFFRAGSSILLCFNPETTREDEILPPHYGGGNQHLAFEVPNQEYGLWKAFLEEKGIPIIHEQNWKKGLKSFYFRDDEGNVLEIVMEGIWED